MPTEHGKLAESRLGMGAHGSGSSGGGKGEEEAKKEGGNTTTTKGTGEKNNNNNAPEEEDESPRRSSRVRFHDDTKEGAAQDPAPTNAPSSKNANQIIGTTTRIIIIIHSGACCRSRRIDCRGMEIGSM